MLYEITYLHSFRGRTLDKVETNEAIYLVFQKSCGLLVDG